MGGMQTDIDGSLAAAAAAAEVDGSLFIVAGDEACDGSNAN